MIGKFDVISGHIDNILLVAKKTFPNVTVCIFILALKILMFNSTIVM